MQLVFQSSKTTKVRFFRAKLPLLKVIQSGDFLLLDPRAGVSARLPTRRLPAGERAKSWSELEACLDWLFRQRARRSQALVVAGGGAALDLGSFAASLYGRGMKLVLVPSTLLGMVDATLGGKTAVDRRARSSLSKNFAGTFYPADEVLVFPSLLSTLPRRERLSGAGEVWKTLWIGGHKVPHALADFVREGRVTPALSGVIKKCLSTKRGVVERDPLDQKRVREILNFGHTVGHALEALAGGRLSHGEAILWGMASESLLLGARGRKMADMARDTIASLNLPLPREFFSADSRWRARLAADKKIRGGKVELTLLAAPGKPVRLRVGTEEILRALKEFRGSYRPAKMHPPK